jgi:hypothetical protein
VGAEGVVRHQLPGHLLREVGREAPTDIDGGQLGLLRDRILLQFRALA